LARTELLKAMNLKLFAFDSTELLL